MDEVNWIRVQETHDAIIPKPIFEIVQRLTELDTRTAPASDSVYILSKFLSCDDCGQNMIRRTDSGKKRSLKANMLAALISPEFLLDILVFL